MIESLYKMKSMIFVHFWFDNLRKENRETTVRLHKCQGRNWLPKAGWAISNATIAYPAHPPVTPLNVNTKILTVSAATNVLSNGIEIRVFYECKIV